MAKQIIAQARGVVDLPDNNCRAASLQARARIRFEEETHGDVYTGRIDDLIAAGIVTREQIPGVPGAPKVAMTFYKGELVRKGAHRDRDEHYWSITRRGRLNAQVLIGISDAECERRRKVWRAQVEQHRSTQAAAEAARKELMCLPRTHAVYREKLVTHAKILLSMLVDLLAPNEHNGFSYDEEATAEVVELRDEILSILKGGTTLFNAKRQAGIVQAHQAAIARSDSKFVALLGSLSEAPSHQLAEETANG